MIPIERESSALVLLYIFCTREVAMGIRLCPELLWALRLTVNVKSGSCTLWIIRAKHIASDKGAALLSYPSLAESQASGGLYLLTQVKESQVPSMNTNSTFFTLCSKKGKENRLHTVSVYVLTKRDENSKAGA